jgi:alpha-D-xyloside xylohydrolase
MRPLFVDYPDDSRCYDVTDAFLFGPDILVAPVAEYQQRTRDVYLPKGATWTDPWTSKSHEGGQAVTVDAPLAVAPVFLRNGAEVPVRP